MSDETPDLDHFMPKVSLAKPDIANIFVMTQSEHVRFTMRKTVTEVVTTAELMVDVAISGTVQQQEADLASSRDVEAQIGGLPPTAGFLDWIMMDKAEDARLNLDNVFERWVARRGYRAASRLYLFSAVRIAVGHMIDRIVSRVGQVIGIKPIGF